MSHQNGLKLSQEGTTVGVLGGGAWGTALAFHCIRKGHDTMLWARETEVVEGINGPEHENAVFLKARLPSLTQPSKGRELLHMLQCTADKCQQGHP